MHAYMRELNWFAAELSRAGFVRTWCARQITGEPGLICVLWQVPEHVDIEACLERLADDSKSQERYARMMKSVGRLKREIMQPMYTERLDERIRAGEAAGLVAETTRTFTNPAGAVVPAALTLS